MYQYCRSLATSYEFLPTVYILLPLSIMKHCYYFQGGWHCSDDCALGAELDDHVLNYTRGLMSEGLLHLAQRDAVREGDGPAVVSHWRLAMPRWWNHGHYKYFIISHHFLAGKCSETDMIFNWMKLREAFGQINYFWLF